VFDKLEILIENAMCITDVLMSLQPFVTSQTKPIKNLTAGLCLEFSSIEALIGKKDLS
jgi:hypothetical protein